MGSTGRLPPAPGVNRSWPGTVSLLFQLSYHPALGRPPPGPVDWTIELLPFYHTRGLGVWYRAVCLPHVIGDPDQDGTDDRAPDEEDEQVEASTVLHRRPRFQVRYMSAMKIPAMTPTMIPNTVGPLRLTCSHSPSAVGSGSSG